MGRCRARGQFYGVLSALLTQAVLKIKTSFWILGRHLVKEQLFGRKRLGGKAIMGLGRRGFHPAECIFGNGEQYLV